MGLLVGIGILYAIAKKEASQGYDAVNLNIVWDAIQVEIPQ